jgi:hypothetical protein
MYFLIPQINFIAQKLFLIKKSKNYWILLDTTKSFLGWNNMLIRHHDNYVNYDNMVIMIIMLIYE